MEQSLSDTQHRLSVKMNELHAAHQQIEKLEETIGEYLCICYEVLATVAVVLLCFCCTVFFFCCLIFVLSDRAADSARLQAQGGRGCSSEVDLCFG